MTAAKNTCFRRYLFYCQRSVTLRNLVLTLIAIAFLLSALPSDILPYSDDSYVSNAYKECGLYLLTWILVILTAIIPILTFSDLNNRRNLDTLYSFPISKGKISLAKYLCGGISVLFIYTVCFIFYLCYVLIYSSCFDVLYILLFYPVSIIYGIAIYSFFSFIFTRATTTPDGIMYCISWSFIAALMLFAFAFLCFIITEIDDFPYDYEYSFLGLIHYPIGMATDFFDNMIEINKTPSNLPYYIVHPINKEQLFSLLTGYFSWIAVGIASFAGFYFTAEKKKTYHAGEISNSIFGYKFIIPATAFSLMVILHYTNILANTMVLIGMFGSYIIYRMGFRLKRSDVIMLATGLVLVLTSLLEG